MGTTSTFLKSRVSKPTVGKWSSGFTACKKYADSNNLPLIGVWSNGDLCGHCVNFETTVMNSAFKKWMASSGCVFWFGCSSDTSKDDKTNGTGYDWAWKNQSLNVYPFVRVWWKAGKVDVAKSGDDWTGGGTKGCNKFITALEKLLKNFKPDNGTTSNDTTKPSDGCDDGNCDPGCSDGNCNVSDEVKKEVSALRKEFNSFKTEFESKLSALEKKV